MAQGRLDRDDLEAVVEARVAQRVDADQRALRAEKADRRHATSLAVTSLALGIPITAISGALTELPGVIAAWAGIVGVNVAHAPGAGGRRLIA